VSLLKANVTQDAGISKEFGISKTASILKHLDQANIHYAGDSGNYQELRTVLGCRTLPSIARHQVIKPLAHEVNQMFVQAFRKVREIFAS